jgi:hypothetical protein
MDQNSSQELPPNAYNNEDHDLNRPGPPQDQGEKSQCRNDHHIDTLDEKHPVGFLSTEIPSETKPETEDSKNEPEQNEQENSLDDYLPVSNHPVKVVTTTCLIESELIVEEVKDTVAPKKIDILYFYVRFRGIFQAV